MVVSQEGRLPSVLVTAVISTLVQAHPQSVLHQDERNTDERMEIFDGSSNMMKSSLACDSVNVSEGTALCGGYRVEVLDLLCGVNYSTACSASWQDPTREQHESFHFAAGGTGLNISQLPPSCANLTIPKGGEFAMVYVVPSTKQCIPVGWLNGTRFNYTAGPGGFGSVPDSVFVDFGEIQNGNEVLSSYINVTCSNVQGSFSTHGDINHKNDFEVDIVAPCSGGSAPVVPKYVCYTGECVESGSHVGVSHEECKEICVAPQFVCHFDYCSIAAPGENGINQSMCNKICRNHGPPHHHKPSPPTPSQSAPTSSATPWLYALGGTVIMIPITAIWIRYWIRKQMRADITPASTSNASNSINGPSAVDGASHSANVYE